MRRYLFNLWLALTGSDPYRKELDDALSKYEKTADRASVLQELYMQSLENNEKKDTEAKSLQRLVENLRGRLAEKNSELERQGEIFRERMERMKEEFSQRLDKYNSEIDRLKNAKP